MSRTRHHGDKAKQRKFGDSWWWYQSTPKFWNKLQHIRPARKKQTSLLKQAEKGELIENWPDYRKPHIYYW